MEKTLCTQAIYKSIPKSLYSWLIDSILINSFCIFLEEEFILLRIMITIRCTYTGFIQFLKAKYEIE